MNGTYRPDFKSNVIGCLEKFGDIEGALKWFIRADKELSNDEFIELVDTTINNKYISDRRFLHIFSLRDQKRIAAHGLEDIEALLEEYRFAEADDFYLKNKAFLDKAEYKELRAEYWTAKCSREFKGKIIAQCPMDDEDALSMAHLVVKHNPVLCDNFSWEGLKNFIVDNLDRIAFPHSIYLALLEDFAGGIKKHNVALDKNTLDVLIEKILSLPRNYASECGDIWTIFCEYPSMLKKFSSSHKNVLDELTEAYPFERLATLGSYYPPPETSCLNYLQNGDVPLDNESHAQLQTFFQENRYFNCEMILALMKAKNDHLKLELKDILDDLLKRIVTTAFNYKLEVKSPIPNLIFPGCISDFKSKNFQIPDDDLMFCEGRRRKRRENSEIYMLCRNRQCNERTELLKENAGTRKDNYFFDFLREKFGISSDDISLNKDFVHAMGAFNRWNEIAERLVCGYGDTSGCGSPLIYSKSPQVKAGWAAYATTYWRCSNPSCQQVEKAIKLSHCGGCGKIIDSRFDKVSCNRRDGKQFFICTDCGYCCNEHKVSGICPKCGENKGWENLDQYRKRYGCLSCGHEIAVPGLNKGCLDTNTDKSAHWGPTEREVVFSNDDDIPFDDIPF